MENFLSSYFEKISCSLSEENPEKFLKVVDEILLASEKGGKTIIVGNGGSAAISSHVSVDLTKAANIRSINFNEADLLTCFSNDYGYQNWVYKALEFYADAEDFVILISSSGRSKNMINAANYCSEAEIKFATFTGFSPDNPLRKLGDHNFYLKSEEYNVVEMTHHIWLLALVDYIIERRL